MNTLTATPIATITRNVIVDNVTHSVEFYVYEAWELAVIVASHEDVLTFARFLAELHLLLEELNLPVITLADMPHLQEIFNRFN